MALFHDLKQKTYNWLDGRSIFASLLVLFLLMGNTAFGKANMPEATNSRIFDKVKRLESLFADYKDPAGPGVAVALVYGNELIFSKGYGSANLEYDIAVEPSSTIFHIASVSKQFTVFSVLLLEEAGMLSMLDDVRQHIPEMPDFGETITLEHLAAHTGGLRDQWNLLGLAGWRLDDVITLEHVMKLVEHQQALNFSPGDEYLYSNTGFTLLAEVVARVSGQSFAEFTKEHIFQPLGMDYTFFYDDHRKIVPGRAYSYHSFNDGYRKSVLSYANVGATSLFTTVEDLSLWVQNFHNPKVGSPEIFAKMNAPARLNDGSTFGGALGQFVSNYKGLHQISHGGADAGYRTYLTRFPDQQAAVILFSNFAGFNSRDMVMKVTDILLEEHFTEPLVPIAELSDFEGLDAHELEAFTGNYWNDQRKYAATIELKDDTLRYRSGGTRRALVPFDKKAFYVPGDSRELIFTFPGFSDAYEMVMTANNDMPASFTTYAPRTYDEDELTQFAGNYYSEELGTVYALEVRDGKLTAIHRRHSDVTFEPMKTNTFEGNRWYFRTVQFERDDAGDILGMRVSSGRVRDLWFGKQSE